MNDTLKKTTLEIELENIYLKTMRQSVADEAKAALEDIKRAKRLIAKADLTYKRLCEANLQFKKNLSTQTQP